MGFSDMVSWASGPGMIQAPELEEGEIYDYEDGKRTNPDIALSYMGDRVQSLLGHFQKDFEGGVSAENLGPKFGGYGSFLPMHKCSRTDAEALTGKADLPPRDELGFEAFGVEIGMSFSDMGSWASLPGLIQTPELEEGEVCCYNEDKRTNPDIALSDIGDRVHSLLDHFQKDFQGPNFGGYGSFLPMHKRSRTDAEAFSGKAELPRSKSDNPTEQRTPKVSEFGKLGRSMVVSVGWLLEYLIWLKFDFFIEE